MKKKAVLNSQEKIFKASIEEFSEHGFDGGRVDRIAKRAGINKAMIYYHYKSKELLYEGLIKQITGDIYNSISSVSVTGESSMEKIFSIITAYTDYISSLDRKIFKMILREIAAGGMYFKKVAIPNLVVPAFSLIEPIVKKGIKNGEIRDINIRYTFLQTIGGIIFFNIMRIPLEGSIVEKLVLRGNYMEGFKTNMLSILEYGLAVKENKK